MKYQLHAYLFYTMMADGQPVDELVFYPSPACLLAQAEDEQTLACIPIQVSGCGSIEALVKIRCIGTTKK